jgi:hypothetical protein
MAIENMDSGATPARDSYVPSKRIRPQNKTAFFIIYVNLGGFILPQYYLPGITN